MISIHCTVMVKEKSADRELACMHLFNRFLGWPITNLQTQLWLGVQELFSHGINVAVGVRKTEGVTCTWQQYYCTGIWQGTNTSERHISSLPDDRSRTQIGGLIRTTGSPWQNRERHWKARRDNYRHMHTVLGATCTVRTTQTNLRRSLSMNDAVYPPHTTSACWLLSTRKSGLMTGRMKNKWRGRPRSRLAAINLTNTQCKQTWRLESQQRTVRTTWNKNKSYLVSTLGIYPGCGPLFHATNSP